MKYIISYSGGKDSTAALLWAYEQFQPSDIVVVFCDTGWETHVTYDYVAYIEEWCKDHGITFYRVVPPRQFEDMIRKKKMFPFRTIRFCTVELKIKPFHMFLSRFREDNPDYCVVTGERADESKSRANKPEREFDDEYYHCDVWRPLHKWTATDVFALHRKHNFMINPMYYMGFKRVGCAPCIFACQQDIQLLSKHFPKQIDRVRELERDLNTICKSERPLTFFGEGLDIDKEILWANRKIVGTTREFLESSCPSSYAILCE